MTNPTNEISGRGPGIATDLRVLMVASYPPPRGGASVYAERLAEALRFRGFSVLVAGWTRGGASLPGYVHRVRSESEVRSLIRTHRFHVVHHHRLHAMLRHRNPVPPLLTLRELRRMTPPLVVTCGAGGITAVLRRAGRWKRCLVRRALKSVYHFWTKEKELLEELPRLGFDPGRSSYLSSALPLGELPPLDGEVADFVARHRPLIVAAGWLYQPIYRLDMVVQAVARIRDGFPDAGLVLGASRPFHPQGRRAVEGAIRAANMAGRVLHLDDYEHFPSLLAAADASVRATVVEGSSNAVLESLLTGCPTLVSDLPGRPDGAIRFSVDDLDDLVSSLRRVLRDPPPRRPGPAAMTEAMDNLDRICRMYAQASQAAGVK